MKDLIELVERVFPEQYRHIAFVVLLVVSAVLVTVTVVDKSVDLWRKVVRARERPEPGTAPAPSVFPEILDGIGAPTVQWVGAPDGGVVATATFTKAQADKYARWIYWSHLAVVHLGSDILRWSIATCGALAASLLALLVLLIYKSVLPDLLFFVYLAVGWATLLSVRRALATRLAGRSSSIAHFGDSLCQC